MIWRFFINDIEIEEPIGWAELSINIIRDEQWKGIFFEASTSSLGFSGTGFDILYNLKTGQGLKAVAVFRAEVKCEGEEDFEEAVRGRLNFAQYRRSCGRECIIRMPVEQDDCTMTLRNRYDQKVNIDSNIAFNKQTVLQNYDGLGFTIDLPAQEIPVSADASVENDEPLEVEFVAENSGTRVITRPIYANEVDVSLQSAQLANPAFFFEFVPGDFRVSPQLLLDSAVANCFSGDYNVDIRLKGRIRYDPIDADDIVAFSRAIFGFWNGLDGNITDNFVEIAGQVVGSDMNESQWYEFDLSYTNSTLTIPFDMGVYALVDFFAEDTGTDNPRKRLTVEYDNETHFTISTIQVCPPTETQGYMINETLARAVEAVTDRCLTVRSDYYGRVDSQPYASSADGCGSLRMLTNGLKIRQAENNNLTLSVKDLFENLNPIDNIGIGIEGSVVRVEDAAYFYNDTLIYTIDAAPQADEEIMEDRAFSVIKVGYKKWETESVKGLDEFNSTKEFRTGITAVNNPLDITSNFVAAGYVIEQVRTQQFISTGRADNKYDNDTFIICLDRGEGYVPFVVEQGNILNPANIFSPETIYNWRIRPLYNLMRWGKSLFQAYANPSETESRLFFTNGTGNYVASGELADGCKLENAPLPENTDLGMNNYAVPVKPILTLDNFTVEYPLSIRDYKIIKANPYGFINLQCGAGEFIKTYIQNIEYRVAAGVATFNLAVKWP
jgi:hypothetical protein